MIHMTFPIAQWKAAPELIVEKLKAAGIHSYEIEYNVGNGTITFIKDEAVPIDSSKRFKRADFNSRGDARFREWLDGE